MRFVVYDDWRVGILRDDGIHEVGGGVVPEPWRGTPRAMNWLVEHFDGVRARVEHLASEVEPIDPAGVRLRPPVPVPLQLLAAPQNNAAHVAEMRAAHPDRPVTTARDIGFFLKAPGSICGPADAIELPPLTGRRFDHECELAFVVGREARGIEERHALDHVFGYTCLIDVTLRVGGGRSEERPMRKSFATFSPVGPSLVTADEVLDPGSVGLRLWVNGEVRQDANTRDLIVGVAELLAQASHVLVLQPGDLYTTGSPSGVGPLVPGDTLEAEMDHAGRMSLPVRARSW